MWTIRTSRPGTGAVLGRGRARATADEDHQIGRRDDLARLVRAAVGADHADGQRMVVGDHAVAADRRGDGRVQQLRPVRPVPRRARDDRPAPADEDRALGRQDHLGRRHDQIRRRTGAEGGEPAVLVLGPEVEVEGLLLQVVGQPDMGRAGPTRSRGPKGGAEDVRDLRDVVGTVFHLVSGRNSAFWSSSVSG
jgi:hypothetical protein